jgi:hypothetical protein
MAAFVIDPKNLIWVMPAEGTTIIKESANNAALRRAALLYVRRADGPPALGVYPRRSHYRRGMDREAQVSLCKGISLVLHS